MRLSVDFKSDMFDFKTLFMTNRDLPNDLQYNPNYINIILTLFNHATCKGLLIEDHTKTCRDLVAWLVLCLLAEPTHAPSLISNGVSCCVAIS